MTNILKKLLPIFLGLSLSPLIHATGPRVSPSLISNAYDIYTVKLPPFINPDGQHNCYLGKVINEILQQEKIDAVLTILPLARMVDYYLLKDQAFAALNPYLSLSEEEKEQLLEVPLESVTDHYIYYKPAHPEGLIWQGDLKRLKGLRYGSVKGESVEQYRQAGIDVKTMRLENLLTKLVTQEIDFIRLPEASANWFIKQQFPKEQQNFAQMDVPAGNREITILFNKQHAAGANGAAKFQQGLDKLIKNGRFQQLKQEMLKHGL